MRGPLGGTLIKEITMAYKIVFEHRHDDEYLKRAFEIASLVCGVAQGTAPTVFPVENGWRIMFVVKTQAWVGFFDRHLALVPLPTA